MRGIINTNTVWDTAGSPYVVIGNVLVNTGVRLDIQPGVEVLFDVDKYLMIKGTLRAIGTEQDSIIFTAWDTTRRWQRLWFKPEANACSLKYCRISYAESSAIYNEDTLYIGYSTITNNRADDGGGICNYYGTATITNNTITNNRAYYYGGGICNYGTATITNNIITNNRADDGGGIRNYGTATITNNTITNNRAYYYGGGIDNNGTATITNNIITNNEAYYGGGIDNYYYGTATITNNTIIDSTPSTIFIRSSSITLNYNNLNNLNPTGYTVYNNTPDTINARNNYWYTIDTSVINQKIYDFWDDFTLGEVFYQPFLTEPIGVEEKEFVLPSEENDFIVYPNPARSYFTIYLPQSANPLTIKLIDVSGKTIKKITPASKREIKIFLKGINSGIYFLQVGTKIKKFLIIH